MRTFYFYILKSFYFKVLYLKFTLSSIKIKNFLSYKDAEFEKLKDYNVLIGKNNAGKSNLFRILSLLEQNAKSNTFHKSYLYDESEDLDANIYLTFKLSTEFRQEIFEILYNKGYLKKVFTTHQEQKGFLLRNQWENKEIALDWLYKQGIYNFVKLNIEYNKGFNNLIIRNIKVIHNDIETEQTIYEGKDVVNGVQPTIHGYTNITGVSMTFKKFFTKYNSQRADDIQHNSLYSLARMDFNSLKSLKDHNPILPKIFFNVLREFLFSIYIIPHDRQFRGISDTTHIMDTDLDLNGNNLVKFIHKLIATDQKAWLDDLNNEVRQYFHQVNELTQTITDGDQSALILKEKGLETKLRLEKMGSGILNIAFFLIWLKRLHKDKFLFIEEPELFLFPGLQKKILDKFLSISDNIQIFITTHSRYFLSKNDEICSVYSIQKLNNESIAYKIPMEDFSEIYKEIDSVLDEYESEQNIIYNDSLWVKFVEKAIDRDEDQLWDFKEFLEWWHPDCSNKEEKQVKFCEIVSAFANAKGGLIVIGITDKKPRNIIGIEKIEKRKKSILRTIDRLTNISKTSIFLRDIPLKNKIDDFCNCFFIFVPQTKDFISVKKQNQDLSFPLRVGSEMQKTDDKKLRDMKKNVYKNNFNYLYKLKEFSES